MASFKVSNPDQFDFSKPESWNKWIQRFERFRVASGLGEKDGTTQVNTLIYCMGSEADEIFSSFNLTNDDKKKFKVVKEKFDGYFIPKRNVIFERAKFNKRVQTTEEPVDHFITALYTLSEHCEYGDMKDELIRDRIVVGIKDAKLSEKMQLDPDLTLERSITLAKQSEAVKKQQPIIRGQIEEEANLDAVKQRRNKPQQQFRKPLHKPMNGTKQQNKCTRCGRSPNHNRNNCPAKDATCHKCSKKGHFATACKSKSAVGEIEQYAFLGAIDSEGSEPWNVNLSVKNTEIKFKIDTGADVTVIPEYMFRKLQNVKLVKTDKILFGPGQKQLHVLGKFKCELKLKSVKSNQDIYVVKGLKNSLLGRPAIQSLELLSKSNVENVESLEYKYSALFHGLGKTNWEYTIKLKPGYIPFALSTPRRVPLPLMEKVKQELQRMENMGVISRVDKPTEWCSGMVVVPKSDGKNVRICVDLTKLNESVLRENHPLPSVDQTLAQLTGAKIFSKIDSNSSFWQANLSEESKPLTTFITPFGRYQFERLPFGISSAPEFYQKRMSETLEGFEGVVCHMDDVLVYGKNQDEHDCRLDAVLNKLKKTGITLNADKCEFSRSQLKFVGHIIDSKGIRADPDKVRAIAEMKAPTNVSEVRRFLGMVNQLSKFSACLTPITDPLRELLRKKNEWNWGHAQEAAFFKVKNELSSTPCLGHYDPNRETIVSADASSFGLGAVLKQKMSKDKWIPVAYASRSLSSTESRYAQIEKECLATTWACEKFSDYLIGKTFAIETDHKPLVSLLGSKNLEELTPRLQRFRMRLMRFQFTISYVPGKKLIIADTLSRAPSGTQEKNEKDFESETTAFVDMIMKGLPVSNKRLDEIREKQASDPITSELSILSQEGWPNKSKIRREIIPYWSMRSEFSVTDGILMKGTCIVIPSVMQRDIINRLHEAHQGIVKCRERARNTVWWLEINKHIEDVVKNCRKCAENRSDHAEPMINSEFPHRPWEKVASDLFEHNKQSYLLVVDYYSRFIEIAKLYSTTANSVINHLKSIFSRHGIPNIFMSDNGPQYSGYAFQEFARQYKFEHRTSSPKYPQSNGLAERAVRTVKQMLTKSSDPYLALLAYRSTPLENGFSPSELLMGRRLQTTLPIVNVELNPRRYNKQSVRSRERRYKQQQKFHYDRRHRVRSLEKLSTNDDVYVKDQHTWGTIKREAKTPRSYIVQTENGEVRRNRRDLVKSESNDDNSDNKQINADLQKSADLQTQSESTHYITRSGRVSKPPVKLDL